MALTPITLEKYLGFEEYELKADRKDPGASDISFLLYVAKLIPRTPEQISNVDPGILASYCLAAHQNVSKTHSEATLWWRLKDIESQSSLATAIVEAGAPATNAEKRAKSDEKYIAASKLSAKGEAYVRFLDNMKTNFETAHYWAKSQEIADKSEHKMAGYEPHKIKQQTGGAESTESSSNVAQDFSFE